MRGETRVESWTDSLPRCSLSGIGFVQNATYGTGVSTHSHEFQHEILNLDQNNVRLFGIFCTYNNDPRAAKYVANRMVYEIYTENPIMPGTAPEEIQIQLKNKFQTVVKAYVNDIYELLNNRLLQQEQATEESRIAVETMNDELRAGATILVVILVDDHLYVINCGNSRALVFRSFDREMAAQQLNCEHDIDNPDELDRIEQLGIDPALIDPPTRSVGDCFRGICYTETEILSKANGPPVISDADVYAYKIEDDFSHVLLCSASVVKVISEIGVHPDEVNRFLEDAMMKEQGTRVTSMAQALLDLTTRQHRECYVSGEARGAYNSHDDLSLVLASIKMELERTRFTMDITNSLSLEDESLNEPEGDGPFSPYADLHGFTNHPSRQAIINQLTEVFGYNLLEPPKADSIEEEQ